MIGPSVLSLTVDTGFHGVDFHPELSRHWNEHLGLDHIAPPELSTTLPPSYPEVVGHVLAAVGTEAREVAECGQKPPAHLQQGWG